MERARRACAGSRPRPTAARRTRSSPCCALTLDAGLRFVPQLAVDVGDRVLHPDLVDPVHRIVLEADSWTWHTGKQAHVADCWRYNALVVHGWRVLRFAWEHVMLDPAYVREVLGTLAEHDGPAEATLRALRGA